MYKVRHKPTGKWVKSLGYSIFEGRCRTYPITDGEGKVFERKPKLVNAPDYEVVRVVVLPEIDVTLTMWHPSAFGGLQRLGLSPGQQYSCGFALIDMLHKEGLNVALVSSNVGPILLVDTGLFSQR